MEALRAEARQLAEAAGDEEEGWRLRAADAFWPFWRGVLTPEDEAEGRRLGPAAADYFEARGQWEALSEVLDGYGNVLQMAGAFAEAAESARRRLAIPTLSYLERADACGLLATVGFESGDYAGSVEIALQTVNVLGQGMSAALLGNTAGYGAYSACLSGRWSALSELADKAEEAWEALGRDPGARYLWRGFVSALHVAKAREDGAAFDRAADALQRLNEGDAGGESELLRALLTAYRDDDAQVLAQPTLFSGHSLPHPKVLAVMFLSERGVQGHPDLLRLAGERLESDHTDALLRANAIAEALAAGDDARLAYAIDDAEAHGLIPHAARMRLVLAQRTRDPSQLERARPTLEGLGDQQFLRRLEEVAATLR